MLSRFYNVYLRYFALVISIAIISAVYIFSRDLRKSARKELDKINFSKTIETNDYATGRQVLYRLIPRIDKDKEIQDTAFALYDVLEVSDRDFTEALNQFSKLNSRNLLALVNGSYNLDLVNAMTRDFKEKESNLKFITEKYPELVRENTQKITIQQNNLQFILDELNNYFSLPPSQLITDTEGSYVYRKGVLSGLPIISRMPDPINDLIAFQEILDRIGGRVKFKGDSIVSEFYEKIDELKLASLAYTKKIDELNNEIVVNEKEIEELKKPDEPNRRLWQTRIRMLFLDILKE